MSLEKPPAPKKSDQERFAEIDAMIEDEIETGRREAARKAEKIARTDKSARLEMSGGLQIAAAHAVEETMKSNLDLALQLADAPEAAETFLIRSAVELTRKELGSAEDFNKVHANEQANQLYAHVDGNIHHQVVVALQTALVKRLESATDPAMIAKLHKLLEVVEKSDELPDQKSA